MYLVLVASIWTAINNDSVSFFMVLGQIYALIIIIYSLEFFTSALADGLSLEFEWHQVSSSLQDSSQYSGRSQ